jgi:hypothetical protein
MDHMSLILPSSSHVDPFFGFSSFNFGFFVRNLMVLNKSVKPKPVFSCENRFKTETDFEIYAKPSHP